MRHPTSPCVYAQSRSPVAWMEPGRQNRVHGDATVLACANDQTATTDRQEEPRDTALPGFGTILDFTPFVPAKSSTSSRSSSPGASVSNFPCSATLHPGYPGSADLRSATARRAVHVPSVGTGAAADRFRCLTPPGTPSGGRPTGGRRSQAVSMAFTRLTGHHRFRPGSSN